MPKGTPFNFKDKWTDLQKKTEKTIMIYGSQEIVVDDNNNFEAIIYSAQTADGDEYTSQIEAGNIESFTIYGSGTGTWNVQGSPDPNSGIWLELSTNTDDDYYSTSNYHPWIRVEVKDTASLQIFLSRKFSTY